MIGLGRRDTPGARKEAWRWMRVRTVIHTKDFITRGGVVEPTVSMARLKVCVDKGAWILVFRRLQQISVARATLLHKDGRLHSQLPLSMQV